MSERKHKFELFSGFAQKKRIKSEIIDIMNRSWFIFVFSIISQHISTAPEVEKLLKGPWGEHFNLLCGISTSSEKSISISQKFLENWRGKHCFSLVGLSAIESHVNGHVICCREG